MTKIIPSTDRVLDAQHELNAQPRAVLRLPRVVIEEVNGMLRGRQETIDEWEAQHDPVAQQERLMREVRNPND